MPSPIKITVLARQCFSMLWKNSGTSEVWRLTLTLQSLTRSCRYCDVIKRDVQRCYATVSISLLYTFFDWFLNQKVGKDGRKKREIKKKSTLATYWKVFRLVFERAVGDKLDPKLNRSMHREAKKHFLSEQRRANRCMTIDDLKLQIETTLSTTKKSFKLGELRILAVLFLLLLAPAGSQPEATLNLQFKDIRVALARDPEGAPHKLLLGFTLEFTKTYLSEKEQQVCSRDNVRSVLALNLRYNAANAFDQSVDVSEALRNLAMGHGNSDPFQRHYLGRNISADLWGILRGQKPQQALMKQACSIGHSISRRRPIDLTPEQSASVATHPTIRTLTKAVQGLPRGSRQYTEAKQAIRNEKQRLRKELKQKIRDEWTDKQATDDIERQIHGVGFAKPTTVDTCRPQGPAQKRLLAKLTAPMVTTLKGQYRRRDDAIDAVSAYCSVQEGCTVRRSRPLSTPKGALSDPPCNLLEGGPLYLATLSVFVTSEKQRPRRCFICIGQAMDLPDDEDRLDDLTRGA
ncbi:C2H2 finger domain-containing protein [Colletotrichum chrysophilum]|uniref:C2H2 finger domain-containing protein n=1 Tax=Colletotrichum chrysophilum TaxID=1836956 RepID=A0AAD8ZY05_9PEZI|nr:C2H2 finger domain-containing protein [Colletotrichum chrysophilum]